MKLNFANEEREVPMKRILVVDDDKIVLKLIESYLVPEGYDLIFAEDGLDGIMKVKNESPDLVVLDVVLPEINGYDICYQLRFNEEFEHVPIVLVTEREDEIGEKIGQRVNMRYIQKPVGKDELLEKIRELIGE